MTSQAQTTNEGERPSQEDLHSQPDEPTPSPPNLGEELRRWIFSRYGFAGLFVLALLGFVVFIWWNWDKAKTRPGIENILSWITESELPKADPNMFSVAVARLANDEDNVMQALIAESLSEFRGVETLRLDRNIGVGDQDLRASVKAGHDRAREYLSESNAQIMIWGSVLRHEDKKIPKLFWTPGVELAQEIPPERYPVTELDLDLPQLFWEDLVDVLQLIVVHQYVLLEVRTDPGVVKELVPFIESVRNLYESSDEKGWNKDARMGVGFVLANASVTFGHHSGEHKPIDDAVQFYRERLDEWTQHNEPASWIGTNLNLGKALAILGGRESGSKKLEEAAHIFRDVLRVQDREKDAMTWAQTQSFLGNALNALGQRQVESSTLEAAVEAHRNALTVYTRERTPRLWATAQWNLGNALRAAGDQVSMKDSLLGKPSTGEAYIQQSVQAYQNALGEIRKETNPLDWAAVHHNMAVALLALGDHKSGTFQHYEQAVLSCRRALEIRTRQRVPYLWALTGEVLGQALMKLYWLKKETDLVEEAVSAFESAEEEINIERGVVDWARLQGNLAGALAYLGTEKKDNDLLCEALGKSISAWDVFSTEAPAYAPRQAQNVVYVMACLMTGFDREVYQQCFARHEEGLKRVEMPPELVPPEFGNIRKPKNE